MRNTDTKIDDVQHRERAQCRVLWEYRIKGVPSCGYSEEAGRTPIQILVQMSILIMPHRHSKFVTSITEVSWDRRVGCSSRWEMRSKDPPKEEADALSNQLAQMWHIREGGEGLKAVGSQTSKLEPSSLLQSLRQFSSVGSPEG